MRLKEGSEEELTGLMDALDAVEQPGSGRLHSLAMTSIRPVTRCASRAAAEKGLPT